MVIIKYKASQGLEYFLSYEYDNKVYVVDFNNTLKCFSVEDGSLVFEFKTENSFIKSQKKLSLILIDEVNYFNN